jgi:hypothetical protein
MFKHWVYIMRLYSHVQLSKKLAGKVKVFTPVVLCLSVLYFVGNMFCHLDQSNMSNLCCQDVA